MNETAFNIVKCPIITDLIFIENIYFHCQGEGFFERDEIFHCRAKKTHPQKYCQ